MRIIILVTIAFISSTFSGCPSQPGEARQISSVPTTTEVKGDKRPVLIELFTSEGCSSCPPADRLLSELNTSQPVANAEIIALGFHVDYWDGIGWRDRFSSRSYTKRQEAYSSKFNIGSTYTPQAVVDGSTEFVGSSRGKALDAIAKNADIQKGTVELKINNGKLSVRVAGLGSHTDAVVYLAVAESSLVTQVGGGENVGEKLTHTAVVRDLRQIGKADGKAVETNFEVLLPVNADWKAENTRYVIFVQENSSMRILAVNQIAQ
ncbi:MAG: DUF1223 domain-containing protein [Pyrinomonadaceae bacterium]